MKELQMNMIEQFSEIYDEWLTYYTKQKTTELPASLFTIAHEMKNPLSLMKATLQLMEQDCPLSFSPKIKLLLREVDRMNQLLNDLLHLKKVETCVFKPVDIGSLLEEMQLLFRGIAEKKKVRLSVYSHKKIPFVYGDEERLKQMFINLIKNALEANEEGGKVILSARFKKPNQIEIRIQDTGVGLCEAQQGELFRPFYTTKKEGTGLGLAIVQKILSLHHATITVKSRPQKGCTFIIHFPTHHNT